MFVIGEFFDFFWYLFFFFIKFLFFFRESEDSILFMVKEIYSGLGIETDNQIPQHSMIIERPIL